MEVQVFVIGDGVLGGDADGLIAGIESDTGKVEQTGPRTDVRARALWRASNGLRRARTNPLDPV